MNTKSFYDKSEWKEGPWRDEPDYVAWIDSETQYACVARRNIHGAWEGYVGIDYVHPLFGVRMDDRAYEFVEVHNSHVTLTGWSLEDDIAFAPAVRRWWVGFTASSKNDICPGIVEEEVKRPRIKKKPTAEYRDWPYIKFQIEYLAAQLASMDNRFI